MPEKNIVRIRILPSVPVPLRRMNLLRAAPTPVNRIGRTVMPARRPIRRAAAANEQALQDLADTKSRVAQAMEDTVPIKTDDAVAEVSRAPLPPLPRTGTNTCACPPHSHTRTDLRDHQAQTRS